jgi:hypothetical protein
LISQFLTIFECNLVLDGNLILHLERGCIQLFSNVL